MNNLTDQQKGSLLAFVAVMFITPDSLAVRLTGINSWELVFYRGLIPFVCLLILLLFLYKKNFFTMCFAIGFAGILNAFWWYSYCFLLVFLMLSAGILIAFWWYS